MVQRVTNELDVWARGKIELVERKLSAEVERVGDQIPYMARGGQSVDGSYTLKTERPDIHWWTNGFWPGILWQMYHLTQDERYLRAARGAEDRLDEAFEEFDRLNHDVGFMWQLSAVADWRLTGNERSLARGMHAATLLAGRYNPLGKFLSAFNDDRTGWTIIDTMMNLPLLHWASGEIDDPRFSAIAEEHADTAARILLRGDGSAHHVAVLDPATGELLETPAGQGCAPGSSWSRGQSWAVYGFALSYRHTGRAEYLDAAKRAAHYFCSQVALTGDVPLVDFRAPAEPVLWDTSAGCAAACGLIEISRHVPEAEAAFYLGWAGRLLRAVAERHADWDPETDGIVQDSSVAYRKFQHVHLVYADYFFIEALLRLTGQDAQLW